jgi:hypothetical protein
VPEPDWQKADFSIGCSNMADAWMWSFDVDGRWQVIHGERGSYLIPFSASGDNPVPFPDVMFLANCISFDHDMATVVRPMAHTDAADTPPVEPVVRYPTMPHAGLAYFDALESALAMASTFRFGDVLELRYYEDEPQLTKFSDRLADQEDALALYAMATRQVDILSEYLCLYRVLESVHHDNGKSVIVSTLDDIATYDFGVLYTHDAATGRGPNVFDVYKKRAADRLQEWRSHGKSDDDIARELYGIRNGLAHGKTDVVVDDFGEGVSTVGQALPVVKLLARMVVEG